MTVLLESNGLKLVEEQIAGSSSYSTGGNLYTINELSTVLSVINVKNTAGYVAVGYASGSAGTGSNQVNIIVQQVGSASAALTQVPAGTNLSSVTFTVYAIGF